MTDIPSVLTRIQSQALSGSNPVSESVTWGFGGSMNYVLDRKSANNTLWSLSSGTGAVGSISISPNQAATLQSGTTTPAYTCRGGVILIVAVPDGSANDFFFDGFWAVYRDATEIARYCGSNSSSLVGYFSMILAVETSLAYGASHQWSLKYGDWTNGSGGTSLINYCQLLALEVG